MRLTLLKLIRQGEQRICIKSLFLLALVPSLVFSSNSEMSKLKCDSGANPGQVKRWHYNTTDLIEIYPNGYRRIYDIRSISEGRILAEEDAVRGMYYVNINFNKNDIRVYVQTPLAKYTDSNCKK
jgi:hypothetical protein